MGTTYRYISDPMTVNPVMTWFRSLPNPPEEVEAPRGVWLYFRSMGSLARANDGSIDVPRSPLVGFFPPRVRRGILWTVGEVHFLSTPLRATFPALNRTSNSLKKWLETFPCIFSNKRGHPNDWDYYLEGSIRNNDPPVYALTGALEALSQSRYFVSDDDGDFVLDKLCSALRLRDVHCRPEA